MSAGQVDPSAPPDAVHEAGADGVCDALALSMLARQSPPPRHVAGVVVVQQADCLRASRYATGDALMKASWVQHDEQSNSAHLHPAVQRILCCLPLQTGPPAGVRAGQPTSQLLACAVKLLSTCRCALSRNAWRAIARTAADSCSGTLGAQMASPIGCRHAGATVHTSSKRRWYGTPLAARAQRQTVLYSTMDSCLFAMQLRRSCCDSGRNRRVQHQRCCADSSHAGPACVKELL